MARTRVKLNHAGFKQLLKSGEVEGAVHHEVQAVLSRLNESYAGGTEDGGDRVRGYVVTASVEAMRDNAKNNSILRALGGGSG